MARTPLYQQLRRNVHLASVSLATGETPRDVVERADAARRVVRAERREAREARAAHEAGERAAGQLWSRRGFIGATAGAAGAAGALALGACARPVTRASAAAAGGAEPVIIVGAGIAGLTTAYRLRNAGVPVRLFEAQSRTGGRMLSLRNHFADNQVIELGGELFDTGHTAIRNMAQELGVALDDVLIEPNGIEAETFFFGGAKRSAPEIVAALQPLAARMNADLRRLGDPDVTWRSRGHAVTLDRMTVAQYLDQAGITGWVRGIIDIAYTGEFGLEIDQQSALNLVTMLELDPFHIFGDSDERFHAHEGNDLITQRLTQRVADAIEHDSVLEAVRRTPGGRYTATFRRGGSTFEATSPQIVLAIPLTLLRRVQLDVGIPAQQQRAIAQVDYGTNAKLMIGFSERVWRTRHNASGTTFADLGYQTTWETSRGQDGRAGVITNFTGGRNGAQLGTGTPAEQAQRTVSMFERVFPGAAAARAGMREARFHWPTHEWTQGSYACLSPGQWTQFRGLLGGRIGGVHIIGEHASMEAQGFMEGGCETGEQAAQAILRARRVAATPVSRREALAAALPR